jgi:hypothetical protein
MNYGDRDGRQRCERTRINECIDIAAQAEADSRYHVALWCFRAVPVIISGTGGHGHTIDHLMLVLKDFDSANISQYMGRDQKQSPCANSL